jgi:hypothetical protein
VPYLSHKRMQLLRWIRLLMKTSGSRLLQNLFDRTFFWYTAGFGLRPKSANSEVIPSDFILKSCTFARLS